MDKCCARLKSGGKRCENKGIILRRGFNLCGVHEKMKYVDIFDENQAVWLNGSTIHRSLPTHPIDEQFLRGCQEKVDQYRREREELTARAERMNQLLASFETNINNSLDLTSIGPRARMSNVKKEKAVVSGMCSICQDNINVGENITILIKCNHNFHAECLDPWISKTNTCPDCRERI